MHPKALLEACAELVGQALKLDHPADSVVSRYFREQRKRLQLGPRERATLAETTYLVLRNKLRYDHFLPSGSGPRERRWAILGLHDYLQRQGQAEWLQGALHQNEKAWLDACLQINTNDLLERHRHNLPEWLVAPLKAQLGAEFWELVASLDQTAPLDLRVNALQAKRDAIQAELKAAGIPSTPTPYSPWGLRVQGKPSLSTVEPFVRGDIEVQDEGSQLLSMLVDPKRGEMVVDFCAGAGGKTLALGAAMRSTGRLYAFDTSAHRLEAFKPRLARSGLSNVHPAAIAHERDERIKRLAGKIDRVLVDAPCSGLGTLRRNPDLKWRQSPQSVAELTAKQTAILASAARLLKSGGRLVYATCSVLPEENEAIAQAFGAAHPQYQPLPVREVLQGLQVPHAERLCTPDGLYLRLWPHTHGTDGFFAAAWVAR